MDPETITTIISLISGIVGGNIAGAGMGEKSLGVIGNTIAGLIGGGAGEFILKLLGVIGAGAAATQAPGVDASNLANLDITSILASIGLGGVSGGVLTAIIGMIKDSFVNK